MLASALLLNFLMAGCAFPPKKETAHRQDASTWRGRLAVRVETAQPQSFSASFELTGSAVAGEMTLFNPLGGTAAVLTWDAQTATMRVNGDVQHHPSLNALISRAIGTEIPVGALFGWLAGELAVAEGWNPDLSQHANGRILAKRTSPAPPVELRLVLENE
jgi:outer membrane lipoprotein LolB